MDIQIRNYLILHIYCSFFTLPKIFLSKKKNLYDNVLEALIIIKLIIRKRPGRRGYNRSAV